jgi:hypothetical protein
MYLPEEGDDPGVRGGGEPGGSSVHMAPGSGLIKRCPVEGCNRVLSRQNSARYTRSRRRFRYDLRIKGVLDDGIRTRNILVQKELVEALPECSSSRRSPLPSPAPWAWTRSSSSPTPIAPVAPAIRAPMPTVACVSPAKSVRSATMLAFQAPPVAVIAPVTM